VYRADADEMSTTALTGEISTGALDQAVLVKEATRFGLTRSQLRGGRWQRISRGLYTARADNPRTLAELSAMVAGVLPRDSAFGHLTSAELRGWWLPLGLTPGCADLLLASTTSNVHVQRRGLYVRRSAYTEIQEINGIPIASAPITLLELAADLTLVDLVPIVDCALRNDTTAEEIDAVSRLRSRGSRTLRRALALSDPRSESWWESVLRLMHVQAGLGPVESQVELFDGAEFIARADLHLVGTSRYPECDGGEHRTRKRHEHDLQRDKCMHRIGAERFGYTTAEIAHQPHMIIGDAESARGLTPDPARSSRWWRIARQSTLTGHGRARLRGRLLRYRLASRR
jgi:hypothetical protein